MPTMNELGWLEWRGRPRNVWMSTSHVPHGPEVQKRAYSYNPTP